LLNRDRCEYNLSLMWKKIRILLSVSLLLFSITLLAWSFLPAKKQVEVHIMQPSMMGVKSDAEDQPAILENRRVSLEWPRSLRIGEDGAILLNFEAVNEDSPSSIEQTGLVDGYTNYSVMAEANFEVAGIRFEPTSVTRVSMPPGQPVIVKWKIVADDAGSYHGVVWLSLRFLPLDGSTPIQVPIYVKDIRIHGTSFLGMNGTVASLVGGVGVLVSLVFILNDVINFWLTGRKKLNKKDPLNTKVI
jgi:hypothetical protein